MGFLWGAEPEKFLDNVQKTYLTEQHPINWLKVLFTL